MHYRANNQKAPEALARKIKSHAAEGYMMRAHIEVDGGANFDIEHIKVNRAVLKSTDLLRANANTVRTRHQATRVVGAVSDIDVYIEQPCLIYEE